MSRFTTVVLAMLVTNVVMAQVISTTTEYPTTGTPGTALTAFAFQKFTGVFTGDVDNVYVGDADGNFHVYENGVWSLFEVAAPDFPITAIAESHLGNEPYITRSDGIYSYNYVPGASFYNSGERHDLLTGLPIQTADIIDIEEWSEGIWVATKSNGIINYGEEDFDVSFTMANSPLTTNSVPSIGLTSTNHVVIPHGSSISLFRYVQGNTLPWENHDLATTFCDGIQTQYVYVSESDDIWVTTNMGVFNYQNGQFQKVEAFGNRDYAEIIATPTGEVWAFEENVGFHILQGGAVGFVPVDGVHVPNTIFDIKYDKGSVKFLSDLNHGISSATYTPGVSDADGDGVSFTLDGNDNDPNILLAAVEIPDDGIDNDCNGQIDETTTCDDVCIGYPHPTLGGRVFYLNGEGGGLIVYEDELANPDFNGQSMFRWAEEANLRTETGLAYFDFDNWQSTAAHSDQGILDAYGDSGNYAALAIRNTLGSEWRLPTATEAYWIYFNLGREGLEDFETGYYWTSSEVFFDSAPIAPPNVVAIDLHTGEFNKDMAKVQALKVRPVRVF